MVVAVANAGAKVPLLIFKALRLAFADCALVIVIITVLVVTPSCAVITVVIVFGPVNNGILADAEPEATAAPFTVMVAVASCAVGITCTLLVLFITAAVKFR